MVPVKQLSQSLSFINYDFFSLVIIRALSIESSKISQVHESRSLLRCFLDSSQRNRMLGESCRLSAKLDSSARNEEERDNAFPRGTVRLAFLSISTFNNILITFPFRFTAVLYSFPIYIRDRTLPFATKET